METQKNVRTGGRQVTITIQDLNYEIITNYRDAFDEEKLNERFSDILGRYDYIVGDWGYDQLRLKGFFETITAKPHTTTKLAR